VLLTLVLRTMKIFTSSMVQGSLRAAYTHNMRYELRITGAYWITIKFKIIHIHHAEKSGRIFMHVEVRIMR